MQTLGWAFGLLLIWVLYDESGDTERLTSMFSLLALLAAVAIVLLPETGNKELEAISREEPETA